MKKIINYKKYDTDTAKLIGEYWIGDDDFQELREKLYLKKTGEFFLYREGEAALTDKYSCGNNQAEVSKNIIPYSIKETQKWVMENMSGDDYEELFGEVEE